MHMFICYGGLMPGYVDSLSHLGCYLAAIIHDYEHKVSDALHSFLPSECNCKKIWGAVSYPARLNQGN